nr:hypothetical protein [Tanacetum cinerariifolium]
MADTWRTRTRPDPDPAQTRSRPGPGPSVDCLPTTVGRWSGGGQRWSSGSQRWFATGDSRGPPPLTVDHHRDPLWRMDELEGDTSSWYCSSSTRFSTRVQYKVQTVQKKAANDEI